MNQLKRQIQAERIVSIREKIEDNGKCLESHIMDVLLPATTKDPPILQENGSGKMLHLRIENPICKLSGCGEGFGDKDHVNYHDFVPQSSIKLPYVDKLPPYTTWIFLDSSEVRKTRYRNQRMADDQSVVGRRRIYYDQHGSEALICSDSEEETPEHEEEKRDFSTGEDQLLWTVIREHGLGEEVVKSVSNFIGASSLEIQERYNTIKEKCLVDLDPDDGGGFESERGIFESERGISQDKSLTTALDSFDNLFCRRCMLFDCRLHGCSQPVIFASEKQLYWSEHEEDRKPCSDQCYLMFKNLAGGPKSNNAPGLASSIAIEPIGDGTTDVTSDERFVSQNTVPDNSDAICSSEVATGAANADVPVMTICHESMGKRKIMNLTDTLPQDLAKASDDDQVSSKKQRRLDVFDVETGTTEDIPVQDRQFSSKSRHPDETHSKTELQRITKDSENASGNEAEENVGNEQGVIEVLELTQSFNSKEGQVVGMSRNSGWKQMEKELYVKGLEIFGRNSCLIARNLLSGLKTCLEVSSYMHEGGVSMPHRSVIGPSSFMDENGKTDTDNTDQEMPTKSRLIRRRGKARKLKYSMKSPGHPSIWKRIADGKNQSCKQYTPCACKSMCGKQCSCLHNGTCCEKYCGCSKSCKNRFRGCHCAKSQCRSRQCPCFAAGRECDPDVCRNCWVSCGDGSLEEPPRQGDGQCGNMRLLLRQQQRILLAKSDVAGWGAFIKNSVNKNDYLGEYTGELISHREADKRGKIYDRANSSFLFDLNDQASDGYQARLIENMPLSLDNNASSFLAPMCSLNPCLSGKLYVLDAYRKGDKLKFANHSSNPNCYAKVMLVAGDHRVGIFAKEHIEASEELFYDYRYGPDQAPAWARKPEGSKRDDSSASQGRAKKHQSH
ncbi:Histone-lysine N-methyltransferase, EZ [Parasponia andersonii]|uniref:Histone-lysine N-methyltransferase, EZ n=1 Tax=Parasponia andersonii TaxID=3476 RepID=A0A2P5CL10_PARAD|nr:Histone-lysine N-methyltransferase, EZ [Parasponia andersonii]